MSGSQDGVKKEGLYIHVYCRLFKEGDWFVADCETLNMSDQGKTEKDALESLKTTLTIFFEMCAEQGNLFAILKDKGIGYSSVVPSSTEGSEYESLDIPIPLLAVSSQSAGNNIY